MQRMWELSGLSPCERRASKTLTLRGDPPRVPAGSRSDSPQPLPRGAAGLGTRTGEGAVGPGVHPTQSCQTQGFKEMERRVDLTQSRLTRQSSGHQEGHIPSRASWRTLVSAQHQDQDSDEVAPSGPTSVKWGFRQPHPGLENRTHRTGPPSRSSPSERGCSRDRGCFSLPVTTLQASLVSGLQASRKPLWCPQPQVPVLGPTWTGDRNRAGDVRTWGCGAVWGTQGSRSKARVGTSYEHRVRNAGWGPALGHRLGAGSPLGGHCPPMISPAEISFLLVFTNRGTDIGSWVWRRPPLLSVSHTRPQGPSSHAAQCDLQPSRQAG